MNKLNRCQCGAKPAIVEVPAPKPIRPRIGRMRDNVRERAVCEFCGNATGIHHNRKALRREWNSAGWCGQCEVGGLAQRATAVMRNSYLLDDEFHSMVVMDKVPMLWPRRGSRAFVMVQTDQNGRCVSITRGLPNAEGVRGFSSLIVMDDLTDADVEAMIRKLDVDGIKPTLFRPEGGAE